MEPTFAVSTPAELVTLIEGRSDTEILDGLKLVEIDTAFDKIFQGMVDAFLADKAGTANATIQWDIETPAGARTYQLQIEGGKCTWHRGPNKPATVTLKAAAPDFLRLITGKLNGMQAYFTGKLKVSGEIMLAQKQESWFAKPAH
jgi:putative sterol carrier protein